MKHVSTSSSRRTASRLLLLLCAGLLIPASARADATLTVAVASSLYPTLQRSTKRNNTAPPVRLVVGSSGRLFNQILQGAPFDIFVAAGRRYPERLAQSGRVIAEKTIDRGYLGLVIGTQHVRNPVHLTAPTVHRIVIANPEVAPFGRAAKRYLQRMKLWQALQPRLVRAQNALQARMMLRRGMVDAGLIPVSADAPHIATLPYVAVLLRDSAAARAWMERFTTR